MVGGLGGQKSEEGGNMRQRGKGRAKRRGLGRAASTAPPWNNTGQSREWGRTRYPSRLCVVLSSDAVVGGGGQGSLGFWPLLS